VYHDWIEKKVLQKKEIDDDDDFIKNLKIKKVKVGKDKLRSSQGQDESKKKKIYREMRLLESSFNLSLPQCYRILSKECKSCLNRKILRCLAGLWLMKNLQPLRKRGIMKIQRLEENGEKLLKLSLVIWISNKFGRLLRKRITQRIEELSSVNGSSR
jgi:hypothetical protein